MSNSRKLAGALLLGLVLGACSEGGPLEPLDPAADNFGEDAFGALLSSASHGDRDAGTASGGGGRVALFDALAAEIPGFGGLYRTQRCGIVVVLTTRDGAAEAIRIVHAAVLPLMGDACPSGIRVSAEPGRYTYSQLRRYLHAARPLGQIQGVMGAQIDFSLNRLVIVVRSRDVMREVLAALPRVDIPSEAVAFRAPAAATPSR